MFWQQLINGLTIGLVYALTALGFTLVYSVLRIVNFAHGSMYMVGAFFGLTLAKLLHANLFFALIGSMLLTSLLGLVVDQLAFAPIRGASSYAAFLSSLGVSIALTIIVQMIWGTAVQSFPPTFQNRSYVLGSVSVSSMQVVILIVAVILLAALYIWVQHTPVGLAMRAVAHSLDVSRLMGVNPSTIIRWAMAVSGALAAAAGMLVSVYYDAVMPSIGYVAGLKAFTAAVVGGIGSIPGSVLGGILLGVAESLAASYISSGYKDAIAFTLLVVVLLARPNGLLGRSATQKM